jgi:hypothetical protein
MIRRQGHHVLIITGGPLQKNKDPSALGASTAPPYHIISFPTKPTRIYPEKDLSNILPKYRDKVGDNSHPGWMGYASLDIIRHSADELVKLTDERKWKTVCLPQVGAGLGGLEWDEVRTCLIPILDKRFLILSI